MSCKGRGEIVDELHGRKVETQYESDTSAQDRRATEQRKDTEAQSESQAERDLLRRNALAQERQNRFEQPPPDHIAQQRRANDGRGLMRSEILADAAAGK